MVQYVYSEVVLQCYFKFALKIREVNWKHDWNNKIFEITRISSKKLNIETSKLSNGIYEFPDLNEPGNSYIH